MWSGLYYQITGRLRCHRHLRVCVCKIISSISHRTKRLRGGNEMKRGGRRTGKEEDRVWNVVFLGGNRSNMSPPLSSLNKTC